MLAHLVINSVASKAHFLLPDTYTFQVYSCLVRNSAAESGCYSLKLFTSKVIWITEVFLSAW